MLCLTGGSTAGVSHTRESDPLFDQLPVLPGLDNDAAKHRGQLANAGLTQRRPRSKLILVLTALCSFPVMLLIG